MTLEGRRVRLEPLEPRHEEALWEVAQDPRTWRWMRVWGNESRERFHEWWESLEMGFAHYLDDVLVGHTSFLNDRPDDRVVEVGNTWLHPDAWGTDANTEAKYLLMRHAFEDEGYLRVEFKTDAANERSRPALEKVGATFEGVARKHMLVRGGERRDSAWYAVIDDDWPEVKASLERRLAELAEQARLQDAIELREVLLEERFAVLGDLRLIVAGLLAIPVVEMLERREAARDCPEWGEAVLVQLRVLPEVHEDLGRSCVRAAVGEDDRPALVRMPHGIVVDGRLLPRLRDLRRPADSPLDDEPGDDAEQALAVVEAGVHEVVEAVRAARRPLAVDGDDEGPLRRREAHAVDRGRLGVERCRMKQRRT